jgi:hypothetical protein
MGKGVMIYISFVKLSSGTQKLLGGIHRNTDSMMIAYAYFRKAGWRLFLSSLSSVYPINNYSLQEPHTADKELTSETQYEGDFACSERIQPFEIFTL